MTRILHVGSFSLQAKGAFQHSVSIKLSNGLIRNGHSVTNFSDRDVARASSLLGHRRFGRGAANAALRELCRDIAPDLLIFGHADTIDAATIAGIREARPALRVLQWNVDPMFDEDNVVRIRGKLDVVDATLVSTAGEALSPLRRAGKSLGFLPNPVDFSVESGANHERDDLPYDVFYACGNPGRPLRAICGREWNMDEFAAALLAAVPGLRACLPGIRGAPRLAGALYQTALESAAIGLNISRRPDFLLYSSDRLAHMIGNGQAIVMERATGYDSLFSDQEMSFCETLDGMFESVRRLVAEPALRKSVAAAGRRRYHELFNERIVARYVHDVALDRFDERDYPWPTLIN